MLSYALLAFSPGVFWLWFFVRGRSYRPKPRRLLAAAFFFGMLSTIPAGILNELFIDDDVVIGTADVAATAMAMLFVVGPVEECSKFLAVRLGPYRSLYFDEPRDGLVYAVGASLGFASLENLLYIWMYGPEVMLARAPISTLAHVIFGSFWGYALGMQAQQSPEQSPQQTQGRRWGKGFWVLAGLAVAAVVHGVFNILALTLPVAGVLLVLLLVALGLWWILNRLRWAQRVSPFRFRRNYPQVECPGCGRRIFITSRFCQACGRPLSTLRLTALICSNCGNPERPDADYCTRCGDRLLRR